MSTVGVYIGRFQPFHNGHKEIVDRMLADGNTHNYIMLGGPNFPRDSNNPFSTHERKEMIYAAYGDENSQKYEISFSDNHPDDNVWAENLKRSIYLLQGETVRLYGARSDASSFYLDLFPEWEKRLTILDGTYRVHATTIRQWLRNRDWLHIERHVPPGTFEYLKKLVEEEPDTCHKWLR